MLRSQLVFLEVDVAERWIFKPRWNMFIYDALMDTCSVSLSLSSIYEKVMHFL
jgi:hypothetical protein